MPSHIYVRLSNLKVYKIAKNSRYNNDMNEFGIKIANLHIKIGCFYETSRKYCENYIDLDSEKYDFEINITKNDLNYISNLLNEGNYTETDKQDSNLEVLSIHRKISKRICDFEKFIIHGAAISYKNKGYLFVAPSETGKTTHIRLWQKNLDGVCIVNGDKPIISIEDDGTYIYGSPWSGTERYNTNTKVKLDSIVILKQAQIDRIIEINQNEFFDEVLDKVYYSDDKVKSLELIDKAFKNIKTYKLECTMNDSAFKVAYNKLVEEENEN